MKEIKLSAYFARNLGDDLMVEVLLNRYPEYRFWVDSSLRETDIFLRYPNFVNRTMLWKKYGRLNHIANLLTWNRRKDFLLDRIRRAKNRKCACSVYIGGSLYMEHVRPISDYIAREEEKLEFGPLFVIGANFGPYQTEKFRAAFEEYFEKCGGITFRDRYSCQQFPGLDNVAYAPDVVLNLRDQRSTSDSNMVVISVIDVQGRNGMSQYTQDYDALIVKACQNCISRGKRPVLMSFCEAEGDCIAIQRIWGMLSPEERNNTGKYLYEGNIQEALGVLAGAEFILASRFHAMILALCFQKAFFCISYSDKIKWVLDDLQSDAYCDIKHCGKLSIEDVFSKHNRPADIAAYKQAAEKQFEQFERYMKNGKR